MKQPIEISLSTRELLLLIITSSLAVAPHALHLHHRIGLFFGGIVLLRVVMLRWPWLQPGRILLFLLTLAGVANVMMEYPLLLGRHAGVALLCIMLALKLLELKGKRDLYVTLFLGYFVLITQFLFSQEMLLVAYVLLVLTGLTTLLLETSRAAPSNSLPRAAATAALLLIQAVPVMITLFFLFPRFSSPLWNLGVDQRTGITGLSDSMTPGNISELVRSDAVAFRVEFDGEIPPPAQRYWRGPVFWKSDGITWRTGRQQSSQPVSYRALSRPLHYTVTLEPVQNKWLLALDLPDRLPPKSILLPDFQIINERPGLQRFRYEISSRLRYNTGPITDAEKQSGLQLADNITPRMYELVQNWQRGSNSGRDLVNHAFNYFKQKPFYYTLTPPLLEKNPTDQFLFETRRGFCEHYASSFVTLMRIAGVPARLVTGYQGGEINPLGDYLIVRQSDAHAWTEVWLPEEGWVRIDPTSAVAPERIERSFNYNPAEFNSEVGTPIDFNLDNLGLFTKMVRQIRWGVDALNASWQSWVLAYSSVKQSQLLKKLGLDFLDGAWLAVGMVVITSAVVLMLTAILWQADRVSVDSVQKQYLRFCRKLEKKGVKRPPHEGPVDFEKRIRRERTDLRQQAGKIIRCYIGLRYGRMNSKKNRQHLARMVRGFHP